ncbi:hypothetical protein [Kineococcus radiotolerans]|uniref:hypothetical protein n=1 Tax=Kineococcus radiotolerans TaxID=131568 RepID=UPI00059C5E19|nr:hypothetical protein [Kineococcus radiotolerans]
MAVQDHEGAIWMLWLVPAALFSGLSGWMQARPAPERASWERDPSQRGWPRVFDVAALVFIAMAGVASSDSTLPFWARLAIILVVAVVPYQVVTTVVRRRGDKSPRKTAGR